MTATAGHAAGTVSLVARTTSLPDPGPLLALLPAHGAVAWVRHGEGVVGWGEAARVETSGRDRFAAVADWWASLVGRAVVRDQVGVPGSGLVCFGSFAFADDPGHSVAVVPEVIVGHRDGLWWVTTVGAGVVPPPLPPPAPTSVPDPVRVSFADGAYSSPEWVAVVAQAVHRIGSGELDKVVLARDLLAFADEALDPRRPLARLAANYPGCWTFLVEGLLGATPELLVRREGGLVSSRVLAGTIQRSGDDQHDLALAASLARSGKDLEEHEYAVRSVAEALAPHCRGVNVPEAPYVLHLPNVMHLATDVAGVLADESTALELAASLHPSAAVCGTPTDAALALIAEVEGMDRGRYAGPVGWMDAAGDGEWGLALRCAQIDPGNPAQLRLFAGCGIVAGSDPVAELAESQAKLVPVRDALSG